MKSAEKYILCIAFNFLELFMRQRILFTFAFILSLRSFLFVEGIHRIIIVDNSYGFCFFKIENRKNYFWKLLRYTYILFLILNWFTKSDQISVKISLWALKVNPKNVKRIKPFKFLEWIWIKIYSLHFYPSSGVPTFVLLVTIISLWLYCPDFTIISWVFWKKKNYSISLPINKSEWLFTLKSLVRKAACRAWLSSPQSSWNRWVK